eukprot:252260_1
MAINIWKTKNDIQKEFAMFHDGPFVSQNGNITFITEYNKLNYPTTSFGHAGICEYDEKEDVIKIVQKYGTNIDIGQQISYCYCFDKDRNKIFIIQDNGDVVIYNRNTKQWECKDFQDEIKSRHKKYFSSNKQTTEETEKMVHDEELYFGSGACCIYINGHIHIFGGEWNKNHMIYDIETNTYKRGSVKLEYFLKNPRVVKSSKSNTLFIVSAEYIYEVIWSNNQFRNKAQYLIPTKLIRFGCIYNDPYIFIFGGYRGTWSDYPYWSDSIYSFDIYSHKWRESSIHIPTANQYHAVLLNKDIHLFQRAHISIDDDEGYTKSKEHYSINLEELLLSKKVHWFDLNVGRNCVIFCDADEKEDENKNNKNQEQDNISASNVKYLSIQEAKTRNGLGANREKYLNDTDFETVFGMNKDEFYKLLVWKQKNLKKNNGFF